MTKSPSTVAAIDIGSNSVLLGVCICTDESACHPVLETGQTTRLGQNLAPGLPLHHDAASRTLEALAELVGAARSAGADRICAVGTGALREASATEDFLQSAQRIVGEPVVVASGNLEAALAYEAACQCIDLNASGRVAVSDSGGRSTELVFGQAGQPYWSSSLPIGALRLTESHLSHAPASNSQLDEAITHARTIIRSTLPAEPMLQKLVALGGAAVTLVLLLQPCFDFSENPTAYVPLEAVGQIMRRLAAASLDQRRAIPGMPFDRAEIALAGAVISASLIQELELPGMTVSARGIRHAVAARALSNRWPK